MSVTNIKCIVVLGSPGTGKTTLIKRLGTLFKLPVIHLDQHFWEKDWQAKDENRWNEIVGHLSGKSEWIIDGNYFSTIKIRLDAAEMIIYLNFSKWLCLWRIFKRLFPSYGQTRLDMPMGCKEKFNWKFLGFIRFVWNFNKNTKPIILDMLKEYKGGKIVFIFDKDAEVNDFCTKLSNEMK